MLTRWLLSVSGRTRRSAPRAEFRSLIFPAPGSSILQEQTREARPNRSETVVITCADTIHIATANGKEETEST